MRRISTIAFVGMLASTMAGCGTDGEVNSVATPSAPQVVEKTAAAKQSVKPPMLTQQMSGAISSAVSLIELTNPQERIKQVAKGRKDPFGLLPGQDVAPVPTTATTQKVVTRLPSLPVPPAPPSQDVAKTRPSQLPPVAPVLPPPPPQPDLAKAVAVTGVVQVGNEAQAIVKVPNEATSRYVREGQWLSNGQVLVKRIEMNQGSDPVVILQQYGIEVNRSVGEGAEKPGQTGKPTAANPDSP